jgi:hypothetical protein
MRKPRQIRLLIVPVALIALLLVCMTLGSVWHHHTGSSEATCQICHLNHQPLQQWPSVDRTPALTQSGPTPDLPDCRFAPRAVVRQIPARAPPTA